MIPNKCTENLKDIGYNILNEYGLYHVRIHFKNVKRGWSSNKGYISIPLWVFNKGYIYAFYYMIHEITHAIQFSKVYHFQHDIKFLNTEIELLKKYHIRIVYQKVYPKKLYYYNELVYKIITF